MFLGRSRHRLQIANLQMVSILVPFVVLRPLVVRVLSVHHATIGGLLSVHIPHVVLANRLGPGMQVIRMVVRRGRRLLRLVIIFDFV